MYLLTIILIFISFIIITYQIHKMHVSLKTLIWPYLLLIVMLLLMIPPVLQFTSKLFGFIATENFIFFAICGYLFITSIVQEIRIARLNDKVNQLSRKLGIQEKENNDNYHRNN